ncbi:MAG TPA: helix-turn-helix domain-containing protein [Thermoanaerobaculia bacterium]|nr:helix-turn-helix domain-containing protein [Thermoanaerobaculia bacterium]
MPAANLPCYTSRVPTRRTRTPANAGPRWGAELTRIELLRLREVLRLAGLTLTPTRAAVLWGLQRSATPATLAELADGLGSKGWARSAVSRAVNDLVAARLVTRTTPSGSGVALLSPAPEPELPEGTEYYLCDGCSVHECLEDAHVVATSGGSGPKALPRAQVTSMVESLCRRREERLRALLPVRAV